MVKKLFAVYDKVAQTIIGGIAQEAHAAPAIRAFYDALNNPQAGLQQHADDFILFELGELDITTGLILPVLGESPITIATGTQWRETIKPENNQ